MQKIEVFTKRTLSTWAVDLDGGVARLLRRSMHKSAKSVTSRRELVPFGRIGVWPDDVRCKVDTQHLADCGHIGLTPCYIVSERLKTVLERASKTQVQFLPVTLVGTRNAIVSDHFYIANPLLRVDVPAEGTSDGRWWNANAVPRNARIFVNSWFPQLINVDDSLGRIINRRSFVGVRCTKWPGRAQAGRAPAIPEPVIPTVTFTNVREGRGVSKAQTRREAAAAFAREHAMPRLAKLIEQDFVRLGAPATPATPATVREIEKAMGVRLPADYAAIIQTTGTFTIDGEEVLANGKGASHPVVRLTREFRKQRAFKWPDTAVCIYDDGRGGCSFLDTARMANGTCPVVSFDHELVRADGTPRFEAGAPSFPKFVERLARTAMQ